MHARWNDSLRRIAMFALLLIAGAPCAAAADKFDPARWEKDIAAFEAEDAAGKFAPGGIVFVGSSSIRRWDLAKSFPDLLVLNRGFGGSHLGDVAALAERIVIPYQPRVVVIYGGDNDMNAGKSPADVELAFRTLTDKLLAALPETEIFYLAIRPTPKRKTLVAQQEEASHLIQAIVKTNPRLHYVDANGPILGSDGVTRPEFLVADMLHLNDAGYAEWNKIIRPKLVAAMKRD